jgi:hypothetical protein
MSSTINELSKQYLKADDGETFKYLIDSSSWPSNKNGVDLLERRLYQAIREKYVSIVEAILSSNLGKEMDKHWIQQEFTNLFLGGDRAADREGQLEEERKTIAIAELFFRCDKLPYEKDAWSVALQLAAGLGGDRPGRLELFAKYKLKLLESNLEMVMNSVFMWRASENLELLLFKLGVWDHLSTKEVHMQVAQRIFLGKGSLNKINAVIAQFIMQKEKTIYTAST